MRYTTLLQQPAGQRALSYTLRHSRSESFGRIARCTPVATPVQLAPGQPSANDASVTPPASPIDFAPGDSPLLYRTAGIRELFADCSQWVVKAARSLIVAWKRQQQARATYRALRGLDARTLRDIGFHRSEISSVAAEIGGAAEVTRIHAATTSRGL